MINEADAVNLLKTNLSVLLKKRLIL